MDRSRLHLALHDLRQLHEQLLAATRQAHSLADQTQQATELFIEYSLATVQEPSLNLISHEA